MTIEERLEALEKELYSKKRETRWLILSLVLIVNGVLFWASGFMGKPAHGKAEKEIRAQTFIVVDEEGKERGIFSGGSIPRPGFNEKSKDPAWLFRDHPYLAILDPEGEPRAILGISGLHGRAEFQITGGERSGGIVKNGLYLYDMKDGLPLIEMVYGGASMARFMLTSPNGEPSLKTFNRQGKTTWEAP